MKKKKFTLEKVLRYRSYLEKDQASNFRSAMNYESELDSILTQHRNNIRANLTRRDQLVKSKLLDISKIKRLQEEILFDELDEAVLQNEMIKASDNTEKQRLEWLSKKSDSDAVKKLKEKHADRVEKEILVEEQKDIDEVARQNFLNKDND